MMSHLTAASRGEASSADLHNWFDGQDGALPEASAAPVGSFWADATAQQAAIFWQAEAVWTEILQERDSFGWSALDDERLTETQAFATHEELIFDGRPEGGFALLQWEGAGAVRNIGHLAADLGRFLTLEIVHTAGQPYLLGVSRDKDMLLAWRIGEDGALVETSRIDFGAVLGLRMPREMTVRVLGDVPYMLIVGENEAAPGVLAMDETGQLHLAETLLELGVLPGEPLQQPRPVPAQPAAPVAFSLEATITAKASPVWLVAGADLPLEAPGAVLPCYAISSV